MGHSYQFLAHRGISEGTFRAYDVHTKIDAEGKPIEVMFNWGSQGQIRGYNDKTFRTVGDSSDILLFGQERFTAGQNRVITITEGAYDALAAYQMLGGGYPVVVGVL